MSGRRARGGVFRHRRRSRGLFESGTPLRRALEEKIVPGIMEKAERISDAQALGTPGYQAKTLQDYGDATPRPGVEASLYGERAFGAGVTQTPMGEAGTPGPMTRFLTPEQAEARTTGPYMEPFRGLGALLTPDQARYKELHEEGERIREEAGRGLAEAEAMMPGRASVVTGEGIRYEFTPEQIRRGTSAFVLGAVRDFVRMKPAGGLSPEERTNVEDNYQWLKNFAPDRPVTDYDYEITQKVGALKELLAADTELKRGEFGGGTVTVPGGAGFGETPTQVPVDFYLRQKKMERAQAEADKTGKSVLIPGRGKGEIATYVHPKGPRKGKQLTIPGAKRPVAEALGVREKKPSDLLAKARARSMDKKFQKSLDKELSRVLKGKTPEQRRSLWTVIKDKRVKKVIEPFLTLPSELPVKTIMSSITTTIATRKVWEDGWNSADDKDEWVSLFGPHPYQGYFPKMSTEELLKVDEDELLEVIISKWQKIGKRLRKEAK